MFSLIKSQDPNRKMVPCLLYLRQYSSYYIYWRAHVRIKTDFESYLYDLITTFFIFLLVYNAIIEFQLQVMIDAHPTYEQPNL